MKGTSAPWESACGGEGAGSPGTSWGSVSSCAVLRSPPTCLLHPCSSPPPQRHPRVLAGRLQREWRGFLSPRLKLELGVPQVNVPGAGNVCLHPGPLLQALTLGSHVQEQVTGRNVWAPRTYLHLVPRWPTGCARRLGALHRPGKPCSFPGAPGALVSGVPVGACVQDLGYVDVTGARLHPHLD